MQAAQAAIDAGDYWRLREVLQSGEWTEEEGHELIYHAAVEACNHMMLQVGWCSVFNEQGGMGCIGLRMSSRAGKMRLCRLVTKPHALPCCVMCPCHSEAMPCHAVRDKLHHAMPCHASALYDAGHSLPCRTMPTPHHALAMPCFSMPW